MIGLATPCTAGPWRTSTSVRSAMTIEPDQIRAQIDAVLAEFPDIAEAEDGDIEEIARRLSAAHDLLVHALESAEKG
jgi:hypothetical protein